ncbi:MAG: hypothetical protein KJ600_03675, partial [Nanoarchaeota archaeon]|nr:hypothetical protein [Nanoarchaeota archaeon]
YPQPFVSSAGVADAAIVYGSHPAASVDLVSAMDIYTSLSGSVSSTGTPSLDCEEGVNCVLLAKSSDNLNLGNTWGTFTGTVTDDNLAALLADGTYTANDNDDFDYEQKINLGTPTLTHFQETDYESIIGADEKTPTIGFKIAAGASILNYTLDFTSDAESDVVSSELEDFEGSDLPLLGKSYYISDFDNGTSITYLGKLTLLDTANTGTVNEGETATVGVGDDSYEVSIAYIDSNEVKLLVNGVTVPSSGKLEVGQTYKLSDGAYLGIRDISKLEVSGETGQATFSIGSGKLEIAQTNTIRLNDVLIQEVKGYVYRATGTSGSEKFDKIVLEWISNEDEYLTAENELTMPGFGAVKLSMNDFVRTEEEKLLIENSGDTSIRLIAPIKDGDITINLLYSESVTGNFTGIGKDATHRLATSPTTHLNFTSKDSNNAGYDEYFVASYASSSEAESYLLRASSFIQGADGTKNKTTIEKNVDGNWVEVCKDRDESSSSCNINDVSLTIDRVVYTSGGEKSVHMTGGSGVNFTTLYTAGGLKVYLPYEAVNTSTIQGAINFTGTDDTDVPGHSEDTWYLFMDGENKDDTIAGGTEFNLTVNNDGTSTNGLEISQVNHAGTGGGSGREIGDSTGNYEAYIVDDVAPRIVHVTKNNPDYAEVYYPTGDSESYAQVYLTELGATSSTTTSILVPVKDTDSYGAKNVVVVGGSCVNSLAAELLGSSTPLCGDSWATATNVNAGQYLIQSFTRSGKVATLVAGYNAGDTTIAATAFTTQTPDTTAGSKYIGTTATDIGSVITTA